MKSDFHRPHLNPFIFKFICLVFIFLLHCSVHQDIAGGSGAGNPGGPTRLSLVADILNATGIGKTTIYSNYSTISEQNAFDHYNMSKRSQNTGHNFIIKDSSQSEFNIDSVTIYAKQIQFILEDGANAKVITKSDSTSLVPKDNTLALAGAFKFDAINGTVEPSFDSFFLPEENYQGVLIELDSETAHKAAIEFQGTFIYKKNVHSFHILLNSGEPLRCMFSDQLFTVSHLDTTVLVAFLDATEWLNGVDIIGALDSGELQFNSSGNLIINFNVTHGPARSIAAKIRVNINHSIALRKG